MKQYILKILVLLCLLPGCAAAQSTFEVIRNDNAANTVQVTNGKPSKVSTDDKGRLFLRTTEAAAAVGTLAAASVDVGAYTTIVTNTNKAVILDCYNGTDKTIILSIDGTNPFIYIPTLLGKVLPLGDSGKQISTNLSVRALTADATTGSVICSLIY